MQSSQKVLGIDYGLQRVGVAVSYGTLAEPLTILANTSQLIEQVREIVDQQQVQRVVIGLSEGEMAEKTKAFAAELEKVIPIPIEFMDETLTSEIVHFKLAEKSGKKQTPKGPIDHLAATEILQEWLELNS